MGNSYQLQYLPLFYDDLLEKASYIRDNLSNITAANNLIDIVEKAILQRLPICESFEPYHSIRERKYPYYRIYVNNYVVFYVVIDDDPDNKIMEVRRFLYKRQDSENIV